MQFAREARENSTGLWAYGPEGTTKGDLDTGNSSNTTSSSKETSNNDSSTSTTGGSGKEYYKNCTELRKVYPDGVASDHPAYASKHDRDKDDWACER